MICSSDCNCDAKTFNVKINEDQLLLIELNENYCGIRETILMMKALPTTTQTYSITLKEQIQRGVNSANQVNINDKSISFRPTIKNGHETKETIKI